MNQQLTKDDWNHWYTKVYGFFFRRVANREDVEDLTARTLSDVFMTEDITQIKGLVWTTAKRRLVDYIRRRKPATAALHEQTDAQIIDTPSTYYLEKMANLMQCIENQLNPEDLTIVRKSILEDFRSHELVNTLNLKAPTIRKRLSRSLEQIRQACRDIWHKEITHNI